MSGPPRVSVVVLTHRRPAEVARTVERLRALPERPPIIVVDNGSGDGTAQALSARFDGLELVRLPRNVGAAARNAGVARAATPYVAFCDDDCWWAAGSLARGVELLDRHPDVAVLTAAVRVGDDARECPACACMAASPLRATGLPGRAVVGFMAGASVVRREAFLQAGGYEPRLFLGGEERLLAYDLLARGWHLVYCDELRVHHHPSPIRDARARQGLLLRNDLWVAWLRRDRAGAWRETARVLREARAQRRLARLLAAAAPGLPWVLRHRRPLPAHVEAMCRLVDPGYPQSPASHAGPGRPDTRGIAFDREHR